MERESGEGFGEPPKRRLRLALTQPTEALVAEVSDKTSEFDTESIPDPEFETEEVRVEPEVRFQRKTIFWPRSSVLMTSTSRRCSRLGPRFMRTVPFFMRGVLRGSFRVAIDEAVAGRESGDRNRVVPRMLLHRPRRDGLIPRKKLQERVDKSSRGSRAETLAMVGELSVAQQAGPSSRFVESNSRASFRIGRGEVRQERAQCKARHGRGPFRDDQRTSVPMLEMMEICRP